MTFARMSALVFSVLCAANLPAEEVQTDTTEPVSGAPERCISLSLIDRTEIIDNQNIVFSMKGGSQYRNLLPMPCPGLDRNDTFKYQTATSQLCSVDAITVLIRAGDEFLSGPSCALGQFYPVTEEEVAQLQLQAQEARQK